jgi:hypothetical protein
LRLHGAHKMMAQTELDVSDRMWHSACSMQGA